MNVTAVSTGEVVIGSKVTSPNGYQGYIVAQTSGTPGGVGVYNVWYEPEQGAATSLFLPERVYLRHTGCCT